MIQQIETMRRHCNTLRALLERGDLSEAERAALEHAIESYTAGANMLEDSYYQIRRPSTTVSLRDIDPEKFRARMDEVDAELRERDGYVDCTVCKRPWFMIHLTSAEAAAFVCSVCAQKRC